MEEAKSIFTPVASGVRMKLDEDEMTYESPYSELVGVLLYLANTVRPDISFIVGRLPRFFSNPKSSQCVADRSVLRNRKGCKNK